MTPAFFSVAYAPFFVTVLIARAESFTVTNRFSSGTQSRRVLRFGMNMPGRIRGDVTADAALFLGHAATMDDMALDRAGFGNGANSGHSFSPAGAGNVES